MYKSVNPLFLISQTPMHAGSGDSLGIVDMPIQRERHTSFPKIEGSSLKGAVRENIEQNILNISKADKEATEDEKKEKFEKLKELITKTNKAFGYDDAALKGFSKSDIKDLFTEKERDFSGALGFTDARLLLFPVKSMRGVFAWITCPKVLQQFAEDIALTSAGFDENTKTLFQNIANNINEGEALVISDTNLKIGQEDNYKIILEEYAFTAKIQENEEITKLGGWLETNIFADAIPYIKNKIKKDIVILDNDAFKDFVNLSTEVITRTKISNVTGTVDKETGALFTEEYLPSETVMYSLVLAADEFTKNETKLSQSEIVDFFETNLPSVIQIGGNATIGKGLTKTYFMKGGTKND